LPPVLVRDGRHPDHPPHLAFAAVVAAQQVEQLRRVHRVGLDPLAAAIDLDGAGIDHPVVDAPTRQGPVQPEAIAAGLVAGADRGAGRQPETCLGLGGLLGEPVEVARRQGAEPWLLGRLRGTGEQPFILAEFQGEVQRLGRGHGWVSVIRVQGSYRTETCTTSDTSLPTWYRTTQFSSRAGGEGVETRKAVKPA